MTKIRTILVVDDDEDIRMSVKALLETRNFRVLCATNADDALQGLESEAVDLILLDILMPDTSGTDLCREIRREHDIPIIFLTGLESPSDRILALELGGDDYVTKPFHPGVLLARVRAVLRRANGKQEESDPAPTKDESLTCGPIRIEVEQHRVFASGKEVEISATLFKFLKLFVEHPRRAFTRAQLRVGVYGPNTYVSDRTINSHVGALRDLLQPLLEINPIETVRGVGYRLSDLCAADGLESVG